MRRGRNFCQRFCRAALPAAGRAQGGLGACAGDAAAAADVEIECRPAAGGASFAVEPRRGLDANTKQGGGLHGDYDPC